MYQPKVRSFTRLCDNSDWSFGLGLRTHNLGEEEVVGYRGWDTRSPMLESASISLKLFGREIIFEEFKPTVGYVISVRYLNVTERQTDGRTDGQLDYKQTTSNLITAPCVASRGKKVKTVKHDKSNFKNVW